MVHQLTVHIINNRKSIDKFEEDDKYILNYVHASRFFHISIYFLGRHFGCLPSSARDQSNEMTIIAYLFKFSRLQWWKVKQVLTAQYYYWVECNVVILKSKRKTFEIEWNLIKNHVKIMEIRFMIFKRHPRNKRSLKFRYFCFHFCGRLWEKKKKKRALVLV